MNPRSSANGIRTRQQLRSVETWAIPMLELFDAATTNLDRHHSVKTDHASTARNLRDAVERMIDAVIQEIQGHD